MTNEDYYKTLGVQRNASDKEIKQAYRKLALKYHPDRNPGDTKSAEQFKKVNQAYENLKDPGKRQFYDQHGHSDNTGGAGSHGGFGGFSDFSDVFNDLFNTGGFGSSRSGRSRGSQQSRGSDLRYDVQLTLSQIYNGTSIPISYVTNGACDTCKGSGSEGSAKPTTCSACKGAGYIRTQQGFFTMEKTCGLCLGEGQSIANPCKKCRGEGRHRKEINISVNIPAGVEEGSKVRVQGKGEAGFRGGSVGDLYVVVNIKPDSLFTLNGNNLYCEVPVRMSLAALGGSIEVPTITGMVATKVPTGTQTGDKLRLKGKGMKKLGSSSNYGDMYVTVLVETPVHLTKQQRDILQQFENEFSGTSPKSDSFLDKVKKLFK